MRAPDRTGPQGKPTVAAVGALIDAALDPAQVLWRLLTALEHDRIGTPAD
ncbi:hypothetical protein [Streptomyces sp. NPDC020571]